MSFLLAPSILSADFMNLKNEIEMLNRSKADWIHLDVMDGVFVPNISIGFPMIEQVAKIAAKPVDAHLMIVEPQRYITRFRDFGVGLLSVHYEACTHLHRTVSEIRQTGMKAGVAINPHTPVEALEDILDDLDLVILMSVNPGFGGQKFIPRTLNKLRKLKKMRDDRQLKTLIEIDGGVTVENIETIVETGADVLVAGNAVFSAKSPEKRIAELKNRLI